MTFSYETADGEKRLEFELAKDVLRIGDESYPCDGRFVWLDGRRVPFWTHRERETVSVWLDGEAFTFSIRDPRKRSASTAEDGVTSGQVKAQMPGKILSLAVKPGDAVKKGQNLLVMESMKMELALNAPTDGLVETVAVEVGQMVSLGQVLVALKA